MAVAQEATDGEKLVHSAMHTIRIPPTLAVAKAGAHISWGGVEIHECEYPDSHLWVKWAQERRAIPPNHPAKRAARLEKDLGVVLALVYADTLRREGIRGYENVHKHPIPIYAPLYSGLTLVSSMPSSHCGGTGIRAKRGTPP